MNFSGTIRFCLCLIILFTYQSILAGNLYEVAVNSSEQAALLSRLGVDALVRIDTGYLVLLDEQQSAQLQALQIDLKQIAADVNRDELALPFRMDGSGGDGLEPIFERNGLKLYRVPGGLQQHDDALPALMPVPRRSIPIKYYARTQQVPVPASRMSNLSKLVGQINQDTLQYYTEQLQAFNGRVAGTISNYHSRDSILAWFRSFGYDSVYLQPFYASIGGNNRGCYNVVCVKPGLVHPEKEVVIGGHFDGVTGSPAADDNGSGAVATLELARVMVNEPMEVTYKFVTFDAEEYGLLGSGFYAGTASNNGDDIILMYNMDMIANLPNSGDANIYDGHGNVFEQLWYLVGPSYGLTGHDAGSIAASDHWPFYQHGYDVLCLHEYIFSSVYHSYRDSTTYMNFEYFKRMTQATLEVVLNAGNVSDQDADGVPLDSDNCPSVYNPDQADPDGDLIGSVCDNCPDHYNPDQIDTDGDGTGDYCDSEVRITSMIMPEGTVNEPYSMQFEAIGGTQPYAWSYLNGDLPPGCVFDGGSTGTLSGTPTAASTYLFTIAVADQNLPPACDTVNLSVVIKLPPYVCGDADGNSTISIGDAVFIVNYIFAHGPAPFPLEAADSSCDGNISIGDAVQIINFIFAGGPAPCESCK